MRETKLREIIKRLDELREECRSCETLIVRVREALGRSKPDERQLQLTDRFSRSFGGPMPECVVEQIADLVERHVERTCDKIRSLCKANDIEAE